MAGTPSHWPRAVKARLGTKALLLAFLALVLLPSAAFAADDATVDHSEIDGDQLKMLVSVPGDAAVDLDSIEVTIGGTTVEATAESASSNDEVRRTTVLAIDTSLSMRGQRIAEARKAALAYLDAVPANVDIGIVSFDTNVSVLQEPSKDRDVSRQVIDKLTLKRDTRLYDGIEQALETTGSGDGQRQILLLSDGADTTGAPIAGVVKAVRDSGVKLDVVSLDKNPAGLAKLQQLADAGKGTVLSAADPEALSAAFASEAAALARQVLVTATVPDSSTATSANVDVSFAADGEQHTASAFLAVRSAESKTQTPAQSAPPVRVTSRWAELPSWTPYAALGGIFVGVVGVMIAFGGRRETKRLGVAEQIEAYAATADLAAGKRRQAKKQVPTTDSLKEQARQAAESVLASNESLEAKIANRLEGAGMALKPSEWILLHAGIAVLATLVGLLLGRGNPVLAVLFLFFGAVGPWVYLGMKRSKRLKAFNSGLADTLQLMSGSLSAGLSLAQSLDTIVREGSEPMTSEFKRVIAETRLGVSLEDAMDGITQRMDSKDFGWVVMAIKIQREVGGNLAELLLTVAATLREREYLRRHVRALSAEGRLSAWILGGLPPGFLGYLALTKPDYVGPMFTQPIGWAMLAGMTVLEVVGVFWMSKVAKVEV